MTVPSRHALFAGLVPRDAMPSAVTLNSIAVRGGGFIGPSIAGLALDGQFLAWLLLADSVKPEARQALQELRELGLGRQLLLTGDRQSVADSLALDVGISDVEAQALPEDKLNRVLGEIGSGFRPMVVGDGINDSLALKAGVVGVAMGAGGADIALASADVVLIGSDLRRLGTCVRLSRQCCSSMRRGAPSSGRWPSSYLPLLAGWALPER